MTEITDIDIFISGGGVAGLTAAAAFGQAGFSVLCADPMPPVTDRDAQGSDLRTTAFLQPSRTFFERIGLWDRLAPHAMPLQIMRIVDAGGETTEPRVAHDFNAADISELPFGWNLPNWLLRREMVAHLASMPNVDFRPGTGTAHVLTREREARVTLGDGTRLRARLVVAADGRNSPVREAAGIGVKTIRYGQKALAFAVTHPIPHENISTEIHRSGGPFTLVPLPDWEGSPSSAIVWMERGPEAKRLMALEKEDFEAEMTERSGHLFGPLTLASRRTIWPIITQVADRMEGERVALIAEAAHVMPPIGAQGLNMSLADLRTLLDLVEAHRDDPGAADLLRKYHRARHTEVVARLTGVDALNRASMVEAQGLRDMRMRALNAIYSVKPVRRVMMQAGLGARG
ncbi:2-octaprenyl-6-methoxyphenol hydroxylase [Roseibacterium elongatum DSM 19469]|uniref:2-octaprenyl-6-methoxyphenol hydroxylase n=1 Tax=Roseicyclus elongatus DSM 19469 TaxID=1294273 RepID=W8RTE6_9RHOB|nr:UbiH/UbiF family hydroxylase [Roseibacterium elongatum]AHM04433.1 2-octaprenyl-6-methoxyphenol hydroxylase [Roseibacterium elongatum DSM 19469]